MKRCPVFIILIFCCTFILTSCKTENILKIEEDKYTQIQNRMMELKTYSANAKVKYISNKGETVYDTYQQCKITGEYKIEITGPENVLGNITVFDGEKIYQYNPEVEGKISVGVDDSRERTEILVTSFLKNYIFSKEVSIAVSNIDEGITTVLEAIVPGDHPYIFSQKLWIDNETLNPVKLVVYDKNEKERIVVTYEDFEYNINLEDSLFKM